MAGACARGDMLIPMRWVVVLWLAGCGPVGYVSQVTRSAAVAVDEARAAQADRYAPYWWTRATQYLHMAREVAGRADFQGANHFGRLATEAADQATHDAKLAITNPALRPIDPGPQVAPAKSDVAPGKEDAP